MYNNPPPEVAALKTMLEACATWTGLSGGIYYPSLAPGPNPTPDAAPSILIDPNLDENKVIAPGVVMPYGTLTAILRMLEVNAAAIEKTARAIAGELAVIPTGLPIVDVKVGMSSGPDSASRAAQDASDEASLGHVVATRTIPIIITYQIG